MGKLFDSIGFSATSNDIPQPHLTLQYFKYFGNQYIHSPAQ